MYEAYCTYVGDIDVDNHDDDDDNDINTHIRVGLLTISNHYLILVTSYFYLV